MFVCHKWCFFALLLDPFHLARASMESCLKKPSAASLTKTKFIKCFPSKYQSNLIKNHTQLTTHAYFSYFLVKWLVCLLMCCFLCVWSLLSSSFCDVRISVYVLALAFCIDYVLCDTFACVPLVFILWTVYLFECIRWSKSNSKFEFQSASDVCSFIIIIQMVMPCISCVFVCVCYSCQLLSHSAENDVSINSTPLRTKSPE